MECRDEGAEGDENGSENLDDLFREIWERESRQELRFQVDGAGTVVQTQDLHGHRWEVNNFSNTVWEAAIWMHHFFQDERCFPIGWFRGSRVLELGAGTGLVGLTLALLGAEVTMTDLPEALPILEHNTEATFGPTKDGDNHGGEGDKAEESSRRVMSLPLGGEAKRPDIRRLCWGDSADAGQVADVAAEATAAAATTTTAVKGEGPEWQGFDMIVGADVIYNEPTFPALVSTLSDRRLCSDTTVVYLATMLRGGRHEELLRQLNETFHVRALDPTCADYLRARVGDGKAWPGPEWAPGQPHLEKRRGPGSPADSGNCCSGKGSVEGAHSVGGNGSAEHEVDAREIPVGTVGMELRGGEQLRGGLSPASDAVVGDEGGQGLQWSYEEKGLGKILSFVARRRGGETTPSTAGPI